MNVPCGVVRAEYWACPIFNFAASLLEINCTAESASLPATSTSPMWLTSNNPALERTAMCSFVMPEYSTGMSHPPNGTIRAPWARCRAFNGVFLRCAVEVSVIERGPPPQLTLLRRGRKANESSYYADVRGSRRRSHAFNGAVRCSVTHFRIEAHE